MTPPRVAVAASGGRDSTALLHCTVRAAAPLGIRVFALHVHHGLLPQADAWLARVRTQARRWGAEFDCRRLQGGPPHGASVEAWARRERYAALADMASAAGCDLVLLAHHRRDQAETWLLQALRGAGPAGLAAMPGAVEREGIRWARPWLRWPRSAIDGYVLRHRLRVVEDPSNADPRFARSRLRLQLWPALTSAFPEAEAALAGAVARAQQAAALAREVAAMDLPALLDDGALRREPWLALPPARRENALRAWLADATGAPPPQTLVDRLLDELPRSRAGRWPAPVGDVRAYRGRIEHAVAPSPAPATAAVPAPVALDLTRPGAVAVTGWGGHFEVRNVRSGGVPAAWLTDVRAAPRSGGERFRQAPHALPRSLKKQYQAAGVPAWQRGGPLLFDADGRLLYVPGLGIDGAALADPGRPQRSLQWVPDAAPNAVASGRGRRHR